MQSTWWVDCIRSRDELDIFILDKSGWGERQKLWRSSSGTIIIFALPKDIFTQITVDLLNKYYNLIISVVFYNPANRYQLVSYCINQSRNVHNKRCYNFKVGRSYLFLWVWEKGPENWKSKKKNMKKEKEISKETCLEIYSNSGGRGLKIRLH